VVDAQPSKLEALRIVTRCANRDQFVAMFRRFCTPTSCFIPSRDTRPIGTATVFSIRLADGSQLFAGEGVVLEAWTTNQNPFKRPGVHLGIHRLSDDSAGFYQQLLIGARDRSVAVRLPPAAQLRMLNEAAPDVAAELETPTVEMPPLPLPEEPRTPGSELVLPANPLTDMTDDLVAEFVECNLTADDAPPPSVAAAALRLQVEPSVIVTDLPTVDTEAVPVPAPPDPTTPNPTASTDAHAVRPRAAHDTIPNPPSGRDVVGTLLGMMPLAPPRIYAAPTPVITELVDRVKVQGPLVAPVMPPPSSRARSGWVPATIAATLTAVALWFTLTNL
jgi:hypothetical protein